MSDAERRRKRREIRLLNTESVWLQKALFAIRKAHDTREKLADVRDRKPDPYEIAVDGKQLSVEALEDALEERSAALVKDVRERRQNLT